MVDPVSDNAPGGIQSSAMAKAPAVNQRAGLMVGLLAAPLAGSRKARSPASPGGARAE